MWRIRKRHKMSDMFLMVWRKRALCDDEKLRKYKVIGDLERTNLLEEMS
jgi:hypothetical protein